MQLFASDAGVGRRVGDDLEIVDSSTTDLYQMILDGTLANLLDGEATTRVPLASVNLLAPVRPRRLVQIGLNYRSHVTETGAPVRATPMYVISDPTDALSGPGAVVPVPAEAPDHLDYECEIAVVIGSAASNVPADEAWSVIAGLTACNDVSARDLQRDGIQRGDMGAGKMCAGFKPFGPGLLTADEAQEGPVGIMTEINGEVRQRSDSSDMVFSIPEIIAFITGEVALEPGDVIITGSPAGVGFFTGNFLEPGDLMEITLGALPPLRNVIGPAPAPAG
jgi:2-keto-4-pentenoate hydratase/2-oxohepta-3-ene-1,7-dioic acid hydratase in catechol pathway